MEYQKAELKDGELRIVESRTVQQSKLTGECWLIQFRGPEACTDCEARDTADCGGKNIRATGKNEKGFNVPV